jgi:uncharacterized protein YbaR (Trm112 family)
MPPPPNPPAAPSPGKVPMVDPELLKILCCPETHQPLHEADTTLLEQVNRAIAAGGLTNRSGQPVNDRIDGALVREDRRFLYPIRGKIPILLIDEALPITSDQ